MQKGKCYYCHAPSKEIAIKQWAGDKLGYVGCCVDCSKIYIQDQFVGMLTRNEYPKIYYGKLKRMYPGKLIAVLHDNTGYHAVYDDGSMEDP